MNIAVFAIAFTSFFLLLMAVVRDPLLNYYQKKNAAGKEHEFFLYTKPLPQTNAPDGKKNGVRPAQILQN